MDSFIRDTNHTLQIIEQINDELEDGKMTLEGVALVTLDVESMYTNMSKELCTEASRDFLNQRTFQEEGEQVSTNSILTALEQQLLPIQ